MAFPTIHGVRHNHQTTNTAGHVVFLPDGSNVVGYLVLVFVTVDGTLTITWPSGWTELDEGNDGSAASRTACRYRVIDGTEGFDGTDDNIAVFVLTPQEWASSVVIFSDWHGATPPELAAATGTSGNADPPNLDPSGWGTEDTAWIAYFGADNSVSVTGYPTDYAGNQHGDNTIGTDGVTHGFATRQLTGGSDNPGTFANGSAPWRAYTVAVRPAAAARPLIDGSLASARLVGRGLVN